jgi:hypothetical protein
MNCDFCGRSPASVYRIEKAGADCDKAVVKFLCLKCFAALCDDTVNFREYLIKNKALDEMSYEEILTEKIRLSAELKNLVDEVKKGAYAYHR